MIEQWKKWMPAENLAAKYSVESICDIIGSFKIVLFDAKNPGKKIRVNFEKSVDAYQIVDKNFKQHIINELSEQYGSDFYEKWTFFTITHSAYVKWLSEESYKISDYLEFKHFVLVTEDSIIDIIANYNPIVELF